MHVLVTANIAISHMSMQEFVYYPDFISIDDISKSKIAESSAGTILRNLQTFFHSGYTTLHSLQQCINVLSLLA